MFLNIDPRNGMAVYEQIVRQVVYAVAVGSLSPGELAPSVRELARELAINPNTVARAYRQLQEDGVLEPVRGTGLAVTAGAPRRCREARQQLLGERIGQVVTEARQSGLSKPEVQRLFDGELRRSGELKE